MAPKISLIGSTIVIQEKCPVNVFAKATQIPYDISAVASSIATTGIKFFDTGPFALYCLATRIVAAGSVAAAIAPIISAS